MCPRHLRAVMPGGVTSEGLVSTSRLEASQAGTGSVLPVPPGLQADALVQLQPHTGARRVSEGSSCAWPSFRSTRFSCMAAIGIMLLQSLRFLRRLVFKTKKKKKTPVKVDILAHQPLLLPGLPGESSGS